MFKERRERLTEQLPQYSVTVLYSGKAPHSIGDEVYPFKVDRSFYYYTGLKEQNFTLLIFKNPKTVQEILFIEPFDPIMAKWVGAKMLPEEAKEISGIKDVRYVEEIDETISSLVSNYGKFDTVTLCGELSKMELDQSWPVSDLFNKIREKHPDVAVKNIAAITARMRMVKDEEEIRLMKRPSQLPMKASRP